MTNDKAICTTQDKIIEKPTDWNKYLEIKTSSEQNKLDKEMQNQVKENGIYSIFKKQNSKEEMIKRLNERMNEHWKKSRIIITGIGVLIAIAEFLMGIKSH